MNLLRSVRARIGRRGPAAVLGLLAFLVLIPVSLVTGAAVAGAVTTCTTAWKSPGTSGSFGLAQNWTSGVPETGLDACLPASTTPYTVTETESGTAQSLAVGTGATLDLESSADAQITFAVAGSITNSGTVELSNTATVAQSTMLVVSGSFDNDGTILVPASGSHNQIIDAPVHNAADGTLEMDGNADVYSLDNDGDVNVVAGVGVEIDHLSNLDASNHTLTGGTFYIAGTVYAANADLVTLDAGVTLDGSGVLEDLSAQNALRDLTTVAAAGSLSVVDAAHVTTPALTNAGSVSIGSNSSLTTNGNYTQTGDYTSFSAGSELQTNGGSTIVNGGDIVGDGTIGSSLVNNRGTIFPAPQLTIGGSFQQGKGATLSPRLGGGLGNSAITVTGGTATLAGTLAVTADPSFVAAQGATYDIVFARSHVGAFKQVASSGLAAPYSFAAVPGSNSNVSVAVVDQFNDNSPSVTYQEWQSELSPQASGGQARVACDPGDSATFAFTGKSITWNTWLGPQMGDANVLIDGVSRGTVDLYAATPGPTAKPFKNLAAGPHTFTVQVLATKDPAAFATCVTVDGFTVGSNGTDDTSRAIGWSHWTGVAVGRDGYHTASLAGQTLQVTTTTTGTVDWITRTGPDQGRAEVLVDGTVVGTADLYSAKLHTGVVVAIPTSAGQHTISIQVLGVKDTQSTGTAVAFDGLTAY